MLFLTIHNVTINRLFKNHVTYKINHVTCIMVMWFFSTNKNTPNKSRALKLVMWFFSLSRDSSPTCALSTPSGWPSCPRTSSWHAASEASALRSSFTSLLLPRRQRHSALFRATSSTCVYKQRSIFEKLACVIITIFRKICMLLFLETKVSRDLSASRDYLVTIFSNKKNHVTNFRARDLFRAFLLAKKNHMTKSHITWFFPMFWLA